MILTFSLLSVSTVTILGGLGVFIGAVYILRICENYCYVKGECVIKEYIYELIFNNNNCHSTFLGTQMYKWWPKQTTIRSIFQGILLLIWLVIALEIGIFVFTNAKLQKLSNVRISI